MVKLTVKLCNPKPRKMAELISNYDVTKLNEISLKSS